MVFDYKGEKITMLIDLVLTDDWEIRGNGSGNIYALQFRKARLLCELYEQFNICGTFTVEVMQQLLHRKYESMYPELGKIADEWDYLVQEMYKHGHDIQLHIHPQWSNAEYHSGKWNLKGNWSLCSYSSEKISEMIFDTKNYLENLIRPINQQYECVAFRAGAWFISPHKDLLKLLIENGIVCDLSIINGYQCQFEKEILDNRYIEESFEPYYPVLDDARIVSKKKEQIICVPTFTFDRDFKESLIVYVASMLHRIHFVFYPFTFLINNYGRRGNDTIDSDTNYNVRNYKKYLKKHKINFYSSKKIGDLSTLTYTQMIRMLDMIKKEVSNRNLERVPVVLENHTKDLGNFEPLTRFLEKVSHDSDFNIITAQQLTKNLLNGDYTIKRKYQLIENEKNKLLFDSLQKRIKDILLLYNSFSELNIASSIKISTVLDEEKLREVMIIFFPKLRRGVATHNDIQELVKILTKNLFIINFKDLRICDAWNNVFEALVKRKNIYYKMPEFNIFIGIYYELLVTYCNEIKKDL